MQNQEGVFSYIAVIKFFLAREIRRKQLNTSPHLQFSMTHNRVCILTEYIYIYIPRTSLYLMKIDMIETPCTFRYRTYAVTFNNVSDCF